MARRSTPLCDCGQRQTGSSEKAATESEKRLRNGLPNSTGVGRCHGLSLGATEGGRKLGHILNHAVDAEFTGRVGVGTYRILERFRAFILTPNLGVTQEKALLGGEAIEFFLFNGAVFQAADQSHEGQADAGVIGAIFAEREPAV